MSNKNWSVLLVLAALVGLSACGTSHKQAGLAGPLCGDEGELVEAAHGDLCVYTTPITETRFLCPDELPQRHEFPDGLIVCAPIDLPAEELEEDLVDLGFLPREEPLDPMVDPEDPMVDPEDPALVCEEGRQQRCTCPDGTPGAQTCREDAWGACECQEEWTAPGVNEVQAPPVGCTDPARILVLQADVDNEEVYPGPCLVEIFEDACPLMRNLYTYEGAELVSDERRIVNQPLFDESIYGLYYGYTNYLKLWERDERGLPLLFTEDSDKDGEVDLETTWGYDGEGRTLSEVTVGPGYSSSQAWTYDEQGRVVRRESNFLSEGQDRSLVSTWEYREDGVLLYRETRQGDVRLGYGSWEYDEEDPDRLLLSDVNDYGGTRERVTYTYREDGSLESTRTIEYGQGIDEDGTTFSYVSAAIDTEFDEEGRELRRVTDYGNNGVARQLTEHFYEGELLVRLTQGPLLGFPEYDTSYFYNEEGALVRTEVLQARTGRDYVTTTHFDPVHGKMVESRTVQEFTGVLIKAAAYAWTQEGLPLLQEQDLDGDGEVDSRVTWSYDRAGNLLDTQLDHNADGFIEERTAYRYRCQ